MKSADQYKISPGQFNALLITTVLPTALLFVPAVTVSLAGRDAWMTEIIVTVFGIMVVIVSTLLGFRFPDKTIIQYSGDILGKYLGKLIGLAYLFFFFNTTAVIIREFADFLFIAYMPRTPLLMFIVISVMLAAYAVKSGLEVIARMNQFVLLLMFLSVAGIFSLVLKEFHPEYLFPILENGVKPVIRGGLTPSAWRGEVFIMVMFIPYLNKYQKARVSGLKSMVILTAVLVLDIIICLGVFGIRVGQFVFPVYYLAYYIGIAGFIERIEAVVLGLWVTGVTVKVAIWYYAAVLASSQLFGLKNHKTVVFPVGLILGVWSVAVFTNTTEIIQFFAEEFPYYAFTFEIMIPLGLLILAVIRKKSSFQQKGGNLPPGGSPGR